MLFLEQNIASKYQSATANFKPSAEQETQFMAFSASALNESESRIMSIAGDTAQINIEGILTQKPDIFAMIFGGGNTTYQEIISAINSAEQNDDIKDIVFAVDSPGGHIDGLFSAVDAMRSTSKPTKAIVSSMAASAAYALVAQADEIVAINEATQVGSIGIMASIGVNDNIVNLKSTLAPKKNPDVTTESGKASVVEHLDQIHDIFVQAIARGRSKTPDTVNKDFGQGGLLLAEKAIEMGMVDSISNAVIKSSVSTAITDSFKGAENNKILAQEKNQINKDNKNKLNAKEREDVMTLDELKSKEPALCAQIIKEGKAIGAKKEKDRVEAHMIMGAAFDGMDIAIKAIAEGTEMDALSTAKYHSAKADKAALAAASDDNADNLDPDATPEGGSELGKNVLALVEKHYGIETPAVKS